MKFFKCEKGFTLIDVSVALIIAMLFMSLISILFFNIAKSSKGIERESQATFIATNIIERYKSLDYDQIVASGTEQELTNQSNIISEGNINIPEGYKVLVTITSYMPEGEVDDLLKTIVVKVKYKLAGKEKQIQLETSITR